MRTIMLKVYVLVWKQMEGLLWGIKWKHMRWLLTTDFRLESLDNFLVGQR